MGNGNKTEVIGHGGLLKGRSTNIEMYWMYWSVEASREVEIKDI